MFRSETVELIWLETLKGRIRLMLFAFISLCIVGAMLFLAVYLRHSMKKADMEKTRELASAIHSGLGSLMRTRAVDDMQKLLESAAGGSGSLERAFIIDNTGKVAFSSEGALAGRKFDNTTDAGCTPCHAAGVTPASVGGDASMEIKGGFIRNVRVIYNEPECHTCHSPSERVNGKLIIDRSLAPLRALIRRLEIIMALAGMLSLAVAWLIIGKGLDRYIDAVRGQHSQLILLYSLVERISETLDPQELKDIVGEVLTDTIEAEEVQFAVPSEGGAHQATAWSSAKGQSARLHPADQDELLRRMELWMQGGLREPELSEDGLTVYIPITRGRDRLVLIAALKGGKPFDTEQLKLISVITNHLAVAFDNARLYWMAITDELTGMYDKRHFKYCIKREARRFETEGAVFTLLMMDLDHFKNVNDTYGHVEGDAVLAEAAARVRRVLRHTDLVFRYGGEEFSAILQGIRAEDALETAERIRHAVGDAPFVTGEATHNVTISIGLASMPRDAVDDLALISRADKALYEAKRAGRNSCVISSLPPAG